MKKPKRVMRDDMILVHDGNLATYIAPLLEEDSTEIVKVGKRYDTYFYRKLVKGDTLQMTDIKDPERRYLFHATARAAATLNKMLLQIYELEMSARSAKRKKRT